MNIGDYNQKHSLPLEVKIEMSKRRIIEWYEYYNGEVYVSFSGGKDSTVLLHLVRSIYSDVEAVFVDTGLEYPELKDIIKSTRNVTTVKPKMKFKDVLDWYGYPIISKEQAHSLRKIRTMNLTEKYRNKLLHGDEKGKSGKISDKYHYLIDAPFKISEQCCDVMKKRPIHAYEKVSKKKPFIGMLAGESSLRKQTYMRYGCNSFEGGKPRSMPLGFWSEQDILQYILDNDLEIATVYGNIVSNGDKLELTGVKRTGCMFCLFGVHLEKEPNRFQQMKITHPKIYDYCINTLKIGEILDFIKVPY